MFLNLFPLPPTSTWVEIKLENSFVTLLIHIVQMGYKSAWIFRAVPQNILIRFLQGFAIV